MINPYSETKISNITYTRLFSENINDSELVWHRDAEDRLLKVLDGGDNWLIQLDNELPKPIDNTYIKKDVYHRLLKGNGYVVLELTKYV